MKKTLLIAVCCVAITACATSIKSIKNNAKEACINGILEQAQTMDESKDVFLTIRDKDQTLDAVYGTPEPFNYKTGQTVKVCGNIGTYKAAKDNKEIIRRNIFIVTSLVYEPEQK
jgi:aspartyl/asparaginyl-tRNA synthetase